MYCETHDVQTNVNNLFPVLFEIIDMQPFEFYKIQDPR